MTGRTRPGQELARTEQAGYNIGAEHRRRGSPLSAGALDGFAGGCRFSELVVRRMLLALDVPARWLAGGRLLFREPARRARFDLFLRRYAYWRGVGHGLHHPESRRRLQRGPVILMYHAIARSAAEPGSCYVVPRGRLRWQLAWLSWRGYHVMSLRDLVAHLRADRLPPARSVVITFDDGYADNHDVALPLLRAHGFPATVFVVSGAVGGTATWTSDPRLRARAMMSAAQLTRMAAAGIEIGAHTRTHPSLTSLAPEEQALELRASREALEQQVGHPVLTFAYPFGDYDTGVAARVAAAGFMAACGSRSGVNDPGTPLLELRRVEVRGTDSLLAFALMVWRGRRARRPSRAVRLEEAPA